MKQTNIKTANNVVFKHTLAEYQKKYGKRSYSLLKFTKQEVEHFEKNHPNAKKGELLKGRRWWLIGDTYYEIPHKVSLRGRRANTKAAISVLAGCCVAAAIAVPTSLAIINRKPVTPEPGPGPVPPTPVVKGLKLSTNTLDITKGEVKTINAKIIASNEDEAIQWTVSDGSDVGIVNLSSDQSNSGVDITVTGNKVGSIKLTASITGFTASCDIHVNEPQVTSLSLNKSSIVLNLDEDETGSVTAYGNPNEATITWSCDSPKIRILEAETTNNVCKFKALNTIDNADNVQIKATAGNQVESCQVTATTAEPVTEKCLVSFTSTDTNAALPQNYYVDKGSKISKPTAYCEGKLLKGWYIDSTEITFDDKGMSTVSIDKDVIIRAEWDDRKVTVTFDPNNGGASTAQQFVINSLIDCPQPEPTREGWIFNGWKTQAGNEWDFATDKVGESDITLVGDWNKEAVILKVTFKDEDGTELETKSFEKVDNGTTPIASTTPTKDEYEFIGWYTEKTGGEEYNFNTQPDTNIELYARYKETIQDFSITHSSNHNLDCDTSSLAAFSTGNASASSSTTNGIKGVKWSTGDSTLLGINESSGIPTLTEQGKKFGGKAIIKASKSYKSLDNPIEHEYEVEIGSFNKLDPEKLKEGIAAARDKNVTGRIVIPSRYYDGSKWIAINKIGDNGFAGLNNIDVYIPVPTIIIGAGAFSGVTGDDFNIDFADKTNTWYFDGVEYSPTTDIESIKNALKDGTNSEKVPTLTGLEFIPDNPNDIKSYTVRASSTFNNKDLLIPQWYYEEGGTGHTVVDPEHPEKAKPVVGLHWVTSEKDKGAFEDQQILESVTFQSNLQQISGEAFKNCKKLQHVYFSPTYDSSVNFNIESNAFDGCESLTELSLPKYLKALAKEAFANSGIEKITLPSKCGKVGYGIFKNCKNLNSVTIEEGYLNFIPDEMFYGCKSLKNITIPRSITEIKYLSFVESGLESIDFEDEYSLWTNDNVSEFEINSKDSNKENAKKLKEFQTKYKEYSLSKSASPLADELFDYSEVRDTSGNLIGYKITQYKGDVKHGISTLEIPSSYRDKPVIEIDSKAFTKEKGVGNGLQIVKIPATIQTIGNGVFEGMKGLKKIEFDRNSQLKKIPDNFAHNCTKLEYVYLPDSVNFIGAYAFVSCDKLAAVDVGTQDTEWKKANSSTGEILKTKVLTYTFYSKDYTRGVFSPSNASYLRDGTLSPSDVAYVKLP